MPRLSLLTLLLTTVYACNSPPPSNSKRQSSSCKHIRVGDKSYAICNESATFEQAYQRCQQRGMSLASIQSTAENSAIRKELREASFLGLTNASENSVWKWTANDSIQWCTIPRA